MVAGFNSLMELCDYFDSEKKCLEYWKSCIWANGIVCPHCEGKKIYEFKDGIRYKCKACRKQFTAKVGTIFESSKIPLRKWFVALYLMGSHKKGVSSHQLARDLKITQKSSWHLLQRLRHLMGVDNDPNETMEGIIEIDETFVGGKNKNRHKDKKAVNSFGRSFVDKTPILGLMTRGGKVKTLTIPNTTEAIILPLVQQIVSKDATVYTDEWRAYKNVKYHANHNAIDHSGKQYVQGDVHTNTIEGFWSWIKRAIQGTWHVVSKKHLQKYASEVTFRYNTRNMTQGERMAFALTLKSGRLDYKKMIAA